MPSASFYNLASWSWCAHAVFRRARQHLEKYPWLTQLLGAASVQGVAVATTPSSRPTNIAELLHAPSAARLSTPHTSFAMSRSLNFWILPVEVFGNSANTT
jgi:hypothetical protein